MNPPRNGTLGTLCYSNESRPSKSVPQLESMKSTPHYQRARLTEQDFSPELPEPPPPEALLDELLLAAVGYLLVAWQVLERLEVYAHGDARNVHVKPLASNAKQALLSTAWRDQLPPQLLESSFLCADSPCDGSCLVVGLPLVMRRKVPSEAAAIHLPLLHNEEGIAIVALVDYPKAKETQQSLGATQASVPEQKYSDSPRRWRARAVFKQPALAFAVATPCPALLVLSSMIFSCMASITTSRSWLTSQSTVTLPASQRYPYGLVRCARC